MCAAFKHFACPAHRVDPPVLLLATHVHVRREHQGV